MMAPFTISPVEKGIMRCRHTGTFSPEDIRSLADFLYNYHGKLLVDLTATTAEECVRNIREFRPMMPTAAIFGAEIDPAILQIPDSYYVKEVRYFKTEMEALAWLREQ
jgi:hypothetical protein